MLFGEPNRAVEGDPALEPAVGEVLAAAASLPDALVGLIPVVADPVDHPGHRLPAGMRGRESEGVGSENRIHRLTVDVQLKLVSGAVAEPHRPRTSPSFQVVEGLLFQVGAAVDAVHDLDGA